MRQRGVAGPELQPGRHERQTVPGAVHRPAGGDACQWTREPRVPGAGPASPSVAHGHACVSCVYLLQGGGGPHTRQKGGNASSSLSGDFCVSNCSPLK